MKKGDRTFLIIFTIAFIALIGLFVTVLLSVNGVAPKGNVARIFVHGPIFGGSTGGFGMATTSSAQVVKQIQQANANPMIKAIVVEINSPGGSAVASDEIGQALKATTKPTVALIREAGASGGYWVASTTDYIIANRMSLTGSIGVTSSSVDVSRFLEDNGISYRRLVAGERKDVGTPLREMSEEELTYLQGKLDRIHQYFIDEVAANRDLGEEQVKKLATGEFFLGVEAKELGLVDELGSYTQVENYLASKDIQKISYLDYKAKPTLLSLFRAMLTDVTFGLGQGMTYQLTQQEKITL